MYNIMFYFKKAGQDDLQKDKLDQGQFDTCASFQIGADICLDIMDPSVGPTELEEERKKQLYEAPASPIMPMELGANSRSVSNKRKMSDPQLSLGSKSYSKIAEENNDWYSQLDDSQPLLKKNPADPLVEAGSLDLNDIFPGISFPMEDGNSPKPTLNYIEPMSL